MHYSKKNKPPNVCIFAYRKLFSVIFIIVFSYPLFAQEIDENYVNSINKFIKYMNKTSWGISQNYFIFSDSYHWGGKDRKAELADKFRRHSFASVDKSKYSDLQLYKEVYMLREELDISHKMLIQHTDSVHFVYKKIINYAQELRIHVLNKKYLQDNFKHYLEIIDNVQELHKTYHRLQMLFRKEIHKIAENLLDADKENPNKMMEMNMRNSLDYQLPLLYKWIIFMNGGSFPYSAIKTNTEYTDKEFLTYEKTPDIDPYVRFHYKRFYSYLNYEHQRFKRKYLVNYDAGSLYDDPKFVIWQLVSAYNIRCVREHDQYTAKAKAIGIYMLNYPMQPYLFIKETDTIPDETVTIIDSTEKTEEDIMYENMDGYAFNHLVLLLDVSSSMNSVDKLPLLKKSFKRLLKILRKEDKVTVVVYSGTAKLVLKATSCSEKEKIINVLNNLKSRGSTNFTNGLMLAFSTALKNFVSDGNNRIILATDGEFKIDRGLFKQAKDYSKKDIHLSIFHFGSKQNNNKLMKLAATGKGNYEFIDKSNVALKLIKEAKAVEIKKD